jgi:hypothetical protein
VNVGATGTDFTYVRIATNQYSHAPVSDVTSPMMTCYQSGAAKKTFSVAAGSQIPIYYSQPPYHPGPYQVYMAKVPAGETAATWQPSGAVWFKIYSSGAIFKGPGEMFPNSCKSLQTHTMPRTVLRVPRRTQGPTPFASPFPKVSPPATTSSAPSRLVSTSRERHNSTWAAAR